jgi:pimeloyl-ACP methyl ester carboxylesterase
LTLTFVLLPGMDGTGQLFEPLVTALGDEFVISVVRYPTAEPLGYGELASIVRAALPRQGSFVLVGESFSGPIAISIAASRPSGLVGVVLACTFARNPRPRLVFLKSLIGLLPASRVPTVCMSYFLLGRFSTEGLRSIMMKAVGMVSDKAFDARLRAVLDVDVTSQLAEIEVPVLYVQAIEDRLVPISAQRLITASCPGFRIARLEAPHFLFQTVPDAAARLLKDFVRSI